MTPQEQFNESLRQIQQALALQPGFDKWSVFFDAYNRGIRARTMGMCDVSPYYEDELRTPYWLAGYHGLDFTLPIARLKPVEDLNGSANADGRTEEAGSGTAPGASEPAPAGEGKTEGSAAPVLQA